MGLNDIVKTNVLDELSLLHKLHKQEAFLSSCISFNSEYKASAFLDKHHYFCDHINTLNREFRLMKNWRQIATGHELI